MRILITGGAGFIGSHLARHLAEQGHDVTVFDMKDAGKDARLDGCRALRGDVTDIAAVEKAAAGQDGIVHLAAMVSVPESIADPEKCERVNAVGSLNVLAAAKRAGAKKVVLASSAAVYGSEPETPTKEDHPLKPLSPYAATKIKMERFASQYAEQGLETCCLRFFNVYGPGQDPKSQYAAAIPAFAARALAGEDLTIYGDGEQTRDFVYVGDVCRAVEAALTRGEGAINIATGKSVTIRAVAEDILLLAGGSGRIVHAVARAGDPRTSLADVSRAYAELGWKPAVALKEGLGRTVESFRRMHENH